MLHGHREEDHPRCRWFAACDRPADGLREHPIIGPVPICSRCASAVGERLTAGEVLALKVSMK